MSTAARTPSEDAEFRGRSGGGSRVGTKPFERALLRLNAAVGVSLPGPSTHAHPLSSGAPASASLRIAWSEMHPALHPDWLAQRENLDARIKERQAQRTALRSERNTRRIPEACTVRTQVANTGSTPSNSVIASKQKPGAHDGSAPPAHSRAHH